MKRSTVTAEAVERRLKEEAPTLRGETQFSPLLHERIMSSLRECGLSLDAPMPRRRLPGFWRIAIPTGIAAAIAVGTWIALRPGPDAKPQEQRIARPPESMPDVTVPQLPPNSTDIASTALDRSKYAYLDRDASRLMTFVADQIPSFPQPK